jgi:hypothetical protein
LITYNSHYANLKVILWNSKMIAVIGFCTSNRRRTAKLEGTFAALNHSHKLGKGWSMDAGTKQNRVTENFTNT